MYTKEKLMREASVFHVCSTYKPNSVLMPRYHPATQTTQTYAQTSQKIQVALYVVCVVCHSLHGLRVSSPSETRCVIMYLGVLLPLRSSDTPSCLATTRQRRPRRRTRRLRRKYKLSCMWSAWPAIVCAVCMCRALARHKYVFGLSSLISYL